MASDDANNDVVASLREAVKGLLYMSESDEPFEVVSWPGGGSLGITTMDAKTILKLTGNKPRTPVETVTLEDFFRELVKEEEWHGEEERADAKKYRRLLEILKSELAEPRVWRLGEVEVEIVILGRTHDGWWVGVKTRAVET